MYIFIDHEPDNCIFLLMDQTVGRVPTSMERKLVSATSSCVAIGAQSGSKTRIVITDEKSRVPNDASVFCGQIETPSKNLSICDVNDTALATVVTSTGTTKIEIWANDPEEPSEILVLWS